MIRKTERKIHFGIFSIWNYLMFFIATCFVVTTALMIFLYGANFEIPREFIEERAKLTFVSIFGMTALLTISIGITRKLRMERPLKAILKATKKISGGDFSVRIPERNNPILYNEFDEIVKNLNIMAKELSSVETLRMDFISNVSHELKTPLAVIQNYATILQDKNISEEKRLEYDSAIISASRHLTSLITNILKLNKLENQQIFPHKKEFDLSEQLAESLLEFESLWEKNQINIETEIEDGIKVFSDAELLSLVWNNLLSNAFKFTKSGGTVKVSLQKDENGTCVTVSDTGCGMSKETKKHIFEKFYQGDASHATKGNGLGLALVKRVCDITGAKISVKSEEGKGSEFKVEIV